MAVTDTARHSFSHILPGCRHKPGGLVVHVFLCLQAIVLHRQQLHSKLVHIMRDRLAKALKGFHNTSVSWAAYNPANAGAPLSTVPINGSVHPHKPVSGLLEQVMQQLSTLAAVLTPIMSMSQLQEIFFRIRRMYSDSLARCAIHQARPCGRNLWAALGVFACSTCFIA
jgi:hypothetical protein